MVQRQQVVMFEIKKASEAEIAERGDLADKVADALARAGFAVHRDLNDASGALGAMAWADPADDSGGGVFVRWLIDPALSRAAVQSVQQGDVESAAFKHFSTVTEQMYAALLAILTSAGFQSEDADDDMSPYTIRVKG
ncbi:hypothetical protein [Streptomyces zaomyceticus]|uniref:hypothetical protein n=1 Tax=Streptomyces zaomyceticus TaxID=68286 RepID=UPI00339FCA7E